MMILFAEDELAMSEAVVDILTYHNYTVDAVYNGNDALLYADIKEYDGMILDIMMPGLDGLSVLRELRKKGNHTPVLLLTARGEVEDCIQGLDAGADDYLPKPFVMDELLARLRAILRRKESFTPSILQFGNVTLDQGRFVLSSDKNSLSLGKLEYKIMELMMMHPRLSFSADVLLERVWGYDSSAEVDTVWVYISYLRKKLNLLGANIEIRSKRGLGYSLEEVV